MIHGLEPVSGRAVPKDQRWIDQPIEGCDAFVVSDLIPTDAVDQKILDGIRDKSLLFGQVDWANNVRGTPFDDYICRKLTRGNVPGFTRMHFCKNFSDEDKNTPYLIENKWGDNEWPAILHKVRFIEAKGTPHSGTDANNNTFIAKRLLARVSYIPEAREGSYFTIMHFVYNSPSDIPRYEAPQPGAVSYDFLGLEDSFQRCLHGDLKFDPQLNAIVAYDSGGNAAGSPTSVSGQFFPATNMEEWEAYCKSDEETQIDILFKRTIVWVDPPDEPEEITR